jgi:hypothetical protein
MAVNRKLLSFGWQAGKRFMEEFDVFIFRLLLCRWDHQYPPKHWYYLPNYKASN